MSKSTLKIFCDGGARGNPGPAASAFVAVDGNRVVKKKSKFLGKTTNNVAEYNSVILGLAWLADEKDALVYETVNFILDSQLVTRQLTGEYRVKSEHLEKLNNKARVLEKQIDKRIFYRSVKRDDNKLADSLVNKTIDENS